MKTEDEIRHHLRLVRATMKGPVNDAAECSGIKITMMDVFESREKTLLWMLGEWPDPPDFDDVERIETLVESLNNPFS